MLPSDCHILILEDEPAVLSLVAGTLERNGFLQLSTSISIAGARQCWHAQAGKFDLLLTDFSLPDGSAIELIKDLVRAKPDLGVVLITGFSEEVLDLEGELRGRVKMLQKPFTNAELIDSVNGLLEVVSAD